MYTDAPTARELIAAALRARSGRTGPSDGSTLSDGKRRLQWAQAEEAIVRIDAILAERGITSDDPVALEIRNSVPGVLILLALLWRGSSFALLPHVDRPELAAAPPRFFRHRIRVCEPPLAERAERSSDWLAQLATFFDLQEVPSHQPLPPESPLRTERLLLRTSGSIEAPKLVVHTHAGLLANAQNAIGRLRLSDADRVLVPVPLAHMYGLGAALLPALLSGASVELIEGCNLLRYLEHERRFCPTVTFLTPNLCGMLLRSRGDKLSYRQAVVAGDRLSPELFIQAEAIYQRVVNLYGSTELGVICATDAQEPAAACISRVGRPLPGVRLRLEPPAAGELPAGSGELSCSHPFGFAGYVAPDGSPITDPHDPSSEWFATRDLARLHDDGSLEVLGRSDHAVKRDGRLVMLSEVERALSRLPGVDRAAVVLSGETLRGRAMVAFLTPHRGVELASDQLRRTSQQELPSFAVPDEFRLLPDLPLLPSGKLDRKALERSIS